MSNDAHDGIMFLSIIAGRKQKDDLLGTVFGMGGHLINVIYGKSGMKSNYIKDVFGFTQEKNKVIITCLLPGEKANALLDVLVSKYHFDQPNTGIAFTIPVEKLFH